MSKNGSTAFFPVLINLKKFPCLIVGGGEVALRKALSLLEFNAQVTVISPRVCKPLIELSKADKLKIILKPYSKEFIKDFKIVFCATNNLKINRTVYQDCNEENILINVADDPELCDFILPANIKRGDLTISIASQGKAPFFTRAIKKKLEEFISPVYSDIAELAGKFRKKLLVSSRADSSNFKSMMFKNFLSVNWEDQIRQDGTAKSRRRFQNLLKEIN